MKKTLTIVSIMIMLPTLMWAGEGPALRKSNFNIGAELQTKYIWRGIEMISENSSPVIFPTIGFEAGGFNIMASGGYALLGNFAELDLTLSYTLGWVTLGLNDYFTPNVNGPDDAYFQYGRGTGHGIEGFVTIEPQKVPVYFSFATLFAGDDWQPTGKRAYSTYAELGGHYDFLDNNCLSLALGATFNPSCYNDFLSPFSVCNIDFRYTHTLEFPIIGDVPVSVAYIVNPVFNKSFLNLTVSFEF